MLDRETINRRKFVAGAACCAAVSLLPRPSGAQAITGTLTLDTERPGRRIPRSFTGLSYELAQLTEPAFFSAEHRDLAALFRRLSPAGILRLGGNSSEFCWFQADAATAPPRLHLPTGNLAANWMPHRLFAIRPEAIDSLAGFLDATGWQVIYGLNFGNSTPERAATEAAFVAGKLRSKLVFFQIGNEPDFYQDANNGTRPPGWGFPDYAREWTSFADAVSSRVPNARFGGPDVGASSDWIVRFAETIAPKLGNRLVALTGHYYAEGPPDDPAVTTGRLLAGNPKVASSTEDVVRVADAHRLTYHMTEGNSCYRGGKPGMSNAFAASLWAADYLLELASLGCAGINLHGGDSRFLSAGLGDHNPGARLAAGANGDRNGFYTPIRSEQGEAATARPVFYGMLLAQQFAGATMVDSSLEVSANVTAYAGMRDGHCLTALINKDEHRSVVLQIRGNRRVPGAKIWRLQGPSLDATTGLTLGGADVGAGGVWVPHPERIEAERGSISIDLPAASAALVFLDDVSGK